MEFISTEGILYLPGGFEFTGKIENGRFEEGVMENYYIKFEGVWGKYYIGFTK